MERPVCHNLCRELMLAESESEVIAILKAAGYWDDPRQWRYYGDNELNWSQAGGQQARADFAFNEKVVNSIDSVLTRMAIERGVLPTGSDAPQSIREAVARFVEESHSETLRVTAGRVEDWPRQFRTSVAQNISVFATEPDGWNSQRRPTISIADIGEGHTAAAFPHTFVSLGQRNKVSIPFVQGKFCQGGSGALRYCGDEKLQLIVSRRMPKLLKADAAPPSYPCDPASDDHWAFTVVRREAATGSQKMSAYSYLAPIDAETRPRKGGVLHFAAESFPIFPDGAKPYSREVEWGTLVKLFEYKLPSSANILRRSGLLQRLDLLLPDPALPLRMHECRSRVAGGKASEQTTTMAGLFTRLRDNENLETIVPSAVPITVNGRQLMMRIFAFKEGKSATYRDGEGVVFTVNGQAHAFIKANIFARKNVGLMRIAKDLLVYVDCSSLSPTELEDAFMSSRDRLVDDNPFAKEIEKRLEEALKDHEGLRELKARRAAEELDRQLADNKPLEDVLKRVLKTSPALARLFGQGLRLHNPIAPTVVKPVVAAFEGQAHPTFFRFQKKRESEILTRDAHIGQRVRVRFETDAENEFFTRRIDHGDHQLVLVGEIDREAFPNYSGPSLNDGSASISFELPEGAWVGQTLKFVFVVTDPVMGTTFENTLVLNVRAAALQDEPRRSTPRRQPGEPEASGIDGPSGIALPNVVWLGRSDSSWASHFGTVDDCLDVIDDAEVDSEQPGSSQHSYTFYLNEENRALRFEVGGNRIAAAAVKKQFEVAITLVGLAMLHDADRLPQKSADEAESEERDDAGNLEIPRERVKSATRALAPIMLPLINSLSDIGQFESDESDQVGQAA
jgi:hypothetical protein